MAYADPILNRERVAAWKRRNPEKVRAQSRHYGAIKKERLRLRREALLAAQRGVCAICGTDEPGQVQGWHLDHDHSCCPGGAREACGFCDRGVLCNRCNCRAVPIVEDQQLLANVQEYLQAAVSRRLVEGRK